MSNWLLLHGTPLTPSVWDGVAPGLSPHGRVLAPAVDAGSQHVVARGLAATDLGAAGPWHVVGHSFGGQVALELGLHRPDLVASLTLLCTRDTPYPPFAAAAVDVGRGGVDVEATLQRWFSPAELAADVAVVRYARATLTTADRAAWARALSAIATFDVAGAIAAIDCPVRVVAADHDQVSGPPAMAAMAARLPRSEFVVLDDAWHMSPFADPARLVALLRSGRSGTVPP